MRGFAFASVLLCAGCTILNKPDPDLIVRDGGTDGGASDAHTNDVTAPPPDGGDAGDGCHPVQEICGNEIDDDCDGLTDCDDFDCAGLAACCNAAAEMPIFTEEWVGAIDDTRWNVQPAGSSFPPPGDVGDERRLTRFTEGVALITQLCAPLALGLDIEIEFVPTSGSCTEDCFAALYLTTSHYLVPDGSPVEDLVLRMDADGILTLHDEDEELYRSADPHPADVKVYVSLRLRPALDDMGIPRMYGTLEVDGEAVAEDLPLMYQGDLTNDRASCQEVPGLFLALLGNGDRVQVGRLVPTLQECVNPSQFTTPGLEDAILTTPDLAMEDWSGPGIGAPTLMSTEVTGGGVRWDVMVDATNADRDMLFAHVGMSLGHARSTSWDVLPWDSTVTGDTGIPKAGANPPACMGGGCDESLLSVREPSILPILESGSLVGMRVAYALEHRPSVTEGIRDRFELRVQMLGNVDVKQTFTAEAGTRIEPADAGCDSLRDPALIPDGGTGHWLFFTCKTTGEPDAIHAVRLNEALGVDADSFGVVLDPRRLGAHGMGGVRDPAVVVEYEPDGGSGAVYRLWYLARDAAGTEITVGMAQAQTDDRSPTDPLPPFEDYAANPLLRAADMPGCATAECYLTGLAVTRRADDVNRLRFLMARRVNDSGVEYQLVPLEQFWRSPWL